jgi:hypothetical protein
MTNASEVLAMLNSAGLVAATGIVVITGLAALLFRRW